MGGLPVIADLDQVPLEKSDLSVDHKNIKKEEYFEECDKNVNVSNEDMTLGILRTNYDKVSVELEKLEVKNKALEEQLVKMKEDEANRLSSAEREISKYKATLEEKVKFEKLLEENDVQKNAYLKKLKITEKRLRNKEIRVKALLTDQSRLENEKRDLSYFNQTLKKENEAIVDVLNKKIEELRKENISIQEKPELFEHKILQNEFGEISSEKMELEDRISNLKEMYQKSQQKIVELKKEIDVLSDDKNKIKDNNEEFLIKIAQLEAAVARGNASVTKHSSVEELKVLKMALEAKQKALANAKADVENLRNMNNQLKKVRQTMREKVNFVQEEKTILKDDLRKLIVELDQAESKREFKKYSNIFMQIMDKVKKNNEKQSAGLKTTQAGEHDYARRVDSEASASSSNVNNNAPIIMMVNSKKRQSSEPDDGQNKVARNS